MSSAVSLRYDSIDWAIAAQARSVLISGGGKRQWAAAATLMVRCNLAISFIDCSVCDERTFEQTLEQSHEGVLLLQGIDQLPAKQQVRLRHFMDRRTVRIIAASERPLYDRVCAGTFDEHLFYRLNTVHISLPDH